MSEKTHNQTRIGSFGWCLLAAGVYAWDKKAEESLSHAAIRGIENPVTKPLVIGAIGYTALHLLHVLPEDKDLFYRFIDR